MRDKSVRCCFDPAVLISFPVYSLMLNDQMKGLNQTRYEKLNIKLKEENNPEHIRIVKDAFEKDFNED